MKKIYLLFGLLIFCILLTSNSYSINEYSIIKIKNIASGKNEEQIGWEPAVAGGFSGPTSIVISKDNELYIPDRVNDRINVYDLNFNFIRTIIEKENKKAHFTKKLKIDDDGNLIYLSSSKGLVKINSNGDNLFLVDKNKLPRQVTQYRLFFPIADNVFIYNDQGEVAYIDNTGKIESADKAVNRLIEIENKNKENALSTVIKITDAMKQTIKSLQMSKKHLIVGDNFYSTSIYKTREYFDKIKDIREYIKSEKSKIYGGEEKKELNINLDDYGYTFYGYDKEHNGYWGAGKQDDDNTWNSAIIIFSKYGEILDAFYYGQYKKGENTGLQPDYSLYPTSGAEIAVAPSGDVYFLVGSKEKYTLYKVERRW